MRNIRPIWLLPTLCMLLSSVARAATLPGPADVGRIVPAPAPAIANEGFGPRINVPQNVSSSAMPPGAENIHLTLTGVDIEGVTAFSPALLAGLYTRYLGHDVTLDLAWKLADQLTLRYRNAGYFLSRAYVPAQSIRNGVITIRVVEGYVGRVDLDSPCKSIPPSAG